MTTPDRPLVAWLADPTPRPPDEQAFLRLVAGLVASGGRARLLVPRSRAEAWAAGDAPDEVLRLLEGLAALGTDPEPDDPETLQEALARGGPVWRLGAPGRPADEQVAWLDANASRNPDRLAASGQVHRLPAARS